LGQQQTEKGIDGKAEKNSSGTQPEAMVQGGLEGCPIGKALRKTVGRKARYALLQTIKACKLKNTCYCERNEQKPKKFKNFTEKKSGATSR
jgi:hypothetical protein